MFELYQAQDHSAYREAQLAAKLEAKRLLQAPRETDASFTDIDPSPARRVIIAVTDTLAAVGEAFAAAGRRPHRI
jgi:hypothetical protein